MALAIIVISPGKISLDRFARQIDGELAKSAW